MTDDELDAAIRSILNRYTVAQHYEASRLARPARRYAVWSKGTGHVPGTADQLIEPTTHAEAQAARLGLITSDLIDLIRGVPQ